MTMITNIEKVNTFNIKDAINTSYIPSSTSRAETNDTKNFMEELQNHIQLTVDNL